MRISKNDIFLHPGKYSGLDNFERLYVSQNLANQIRDFLVLDKGKKNMERLLKMAKDLGFKPMNLVLASYDGMTVICEIEAEQINFALWKHYTNSRPLLFSSHKDDNGKIRAVNVDDEFSFSIAFGTQVFLYFLLFIDVEKKELKPKEKHSPKRYEPIKNDTEIVFTVADANWHFQIDINSPFSVSGHYRLQRYGPHWQNAKIIYIDPFEKSGYHRRAGKENFLGDE